MPKSCRAPHCSNGAGQGRAAARGVSFYRFPLHDAPRLRQWLERMGRQHWVPTRHQHLCSDHFEPSCFRYCWGVRYLRPDAVPTIFPCRPPAQRPPSPGLPEAAPAPARPRVPAAVPMEPPRPAPLGLSTRELAALALGLQRKLKALQQRRRRHRARVEAMEALVRRLRRGGGPIGTEPLVPPAAVTIICPEEEEEEEEEAGAPLVPAVPPPEGTTWSSPEQP